MTLNEMQKPVEEKSAKNVETINNSTKKRRSNYLFLPYKISRGNFLKWLRRTHAWLGLWGAALGILFGVTGILLNHRSQMKISAANTEKTKIEMPLPEQKPDNIENFSLWLKKELDVPEHWNVSLRTDEPEKISWGGKSVTQPGRWRVTFSNAQHVYSTEYWIGNAYVTINKFNRNFFAILNRFHTASGVGIGWILLADSIAGSFIILSLTGILLWTRLHGPRLWAAALGLGSLFFAMYLIFSSF